MKRMIGWCLVGAACLAPVATAAEPATRFAWPDGRRAAVSLAYDDALDSQLDHAIPALDRHRLKGSFYIVPDNAPVRARMTSTTASLTRCAA